ncbi:MULTISPECIES: FMN-dependent NADH-azoreductase [Pseudomonas]|uniref:FMN dependent NADH:quinone oxidoreductase n=1 Tax=Pseudomonas oryzihabitans TaxID=47885 RepID=A0A1G5N2Y8_9PSED|nr:MULTISPECIES: NAD(P)H-dependent oxidoreductase [Pseudomonas]MBA1257871.1 FMN-dependent NADH-azoreductase [Pseudomonas psychrotolerans]NMY88964.1 FMN-dependent NADH-azoreductase [Pseudomonas psychrotolerans]SCZ31514.1 FMN-dependent NADH-azoreductase [Pseudomonas psychrotolerans]
MPRLLHVIGSPRQDRSASLEVATAFIQAWQGKHPDAEVDTLDVWQCDLPEFDGPILDAKYAGIQGESLSSEQEHAWKVAKALAQRFKAADVLVFGVPCWNFGIPYKLKQLFDVVSQKDLLFTFDDRGLNGLLGGRQALVIAARGAALDRQEHQESYLRTWCEMVGIDRMHTVVVEKTLFGPEVDQASRDQAKQDAVALVSRL